MNLLEKLAAQIANDEIKPGNTMEDWLNTLEVDQFDDLERLVTLLDEESEDPDTVVLGQVVIALYAVETSNIQCEGSELVVPDLPENEFFDLLNSFLFLLPFYYWKEQELLQITPGLSLAAHRENAINIRLTEYGKARAHNALEE